jgi:hypothetical protein
MILEEYIYFNKINGSGKVDKNMEEIKEFVLLKVGLNFKIKEWLN